MVTHHTTENKLVVIKNKKTKNHTFGIHYVKAPYHILVCKKREPTFEPPRSGKRKKKKKSVMISASWDRYCRNLQSDDNVREEKRDRARVRQVRKRHISSESIRALAHQSRCMDDRVS